MSSLHLEKAALAHESGALALRQAFLEAGEAMHGAAGLGQAKDYAAWIQALRRNESPDTVQEGLVDGTAYFGVENGQVVGMIALRHRLNDFLLREGGHIGYCVHPAHRRKGYASRMLELALEECRKMGIERVLITCDEKNAASARTILRCGGVLENTVLSGGKRTQRYWIELGHADRALS